MGEFNDTLKLNKIKRSFIFLFMTGYEDLMGQVTHFFVCFNTNHWTFHAHFNQQLKRTESWAS